ncbi:50S ribosomal protein L18 [Nitrosomonas aestuarii]|uniref:50S ribosomal protein L18 n=1 Tax=Nitrosomonas aestuarii TaxID=52441 RepID=UPI000D31D57A|nr:50S ribosomal protein L18 [Nitrosomonas aestuarii]PTN13036.1 LSU ribosomal protein L18P [Nitrosomonas aestuarii]
MQSLKLNRLRRAKQTRVRIAKQGTPRLSVFRTNQHIYAQIIDDRNHKTLTGASTLESEVRNEVSLGGNKVAAAIIGKRIAEKAKKLGISQVAFDRSGYKFHGRVKVLAEAARDNGLKF